MDMLMMREFIRILVLVLVVSNNVRSRRVYVRAHNGRLDVDPTPDARIRYADYEFIKLGVAMVFAL